MVIPPATSLTSVVASAATRPKTAVEPFAPNFESRLDEYTFWSSRPDTDPPPFVPTLEYYTNKAGYEACCQWITAQRRVAFQRRQAQFEQVRRERDQLSSDIHAAIVTPPSVLRQRRAAFARQQTQRGFTVRELSSVGRAVNSTPALAEFSPPKFESAFDEYTFYANKSGARPPPFVPSCDFDIDRFGLPRCRKWIASQRRAFMRNLLCPIRA